MSSLPQNLQPMSFWRSLRFFGLLSAFFAVMYWRVVPLLDEMLGNPLFVTFLFGFGFPCLVLLFLCFHFYRRETGSPARTTFKQRFRLEPLSGNGWLSTLGLSIIVLASNWLLEPTASWMQLYLPSPPKAWVLMQQPDPFYFMEVRFSWWVAAGFLVLSVLRAFAGELWWRGYILPRQEISFGKRAWIIHGILYTLFFVFMPWELIRILPACLAIPFVAQKMKNTWPGIIAQLVTDLPVLWAIVSHL